MAYKLKKSKPKKDKPKREKQEEQYILWDYKAD